MRTLLLHRLGPVLHATLQTLHHELGLPVRRIGRVLDLLSGVQVTQSAVTQAAVRLAADGQRLCKVRDVQLSPKLRRHIAKPAVIMTLITHFAGADQLVIAL